MGFGRVMMAWGLALLLASGAWAADGGTEPRTGADNAPLKLVVGVNDIYCKDSSCKCIANIATRRYDEFCHKLREDYNIDLRMVYFTEPYELDRAFLAGKFDAVLCKPWTVLRRPEGPGGRMVRVADLQDPSGNTGLWGIVIVLKDSAIRKLADISGRRVACGQPDAREKHQDALALFHREGIQIPPDKLVEKASCLECLDLLLKGEVDAAVISNYALTADCAVDFTTPDAFRVLGKTEPIPLTSFMVDPERVPRDGVRRLQAALSELSARALPPSMAGGGFVAPAPWKVEKQ